MPDITMCSGDSCLLKETCYRFKANPSSWQSYFVEAPIENGKCEDYWKLDDSKLETETLKAKL